MESFTIRIIREEKEDSQGKRSNFCQFELSKIDAKLLKNCALKLHKLVLRVNSTCMSNTINCYNDVAEIYAPNSSIASILRVEKSKQLLSTTVAC